MYFDACVDYFVKAQIILKENVSSFQVFFCSQSQTFKGWFQLEDKSHIYVEVGSLQHCCGNSPDQHLPPQVHGWTSQGKKGARLKRREFCSRFSRLGENARILNFPLFVKQVYLDRPQSLFKNLTAKRDWLGLPPWSVRCPLHREIKAKRIHFCIIICKIERRKHFDTKARKKGYICQTTRSPFGFSYLFSTWTKYIWYQSYASTLVWNYELITHRSKVKSY